MKITNHGSRDKALINRKRLKLLTRIFKDKEFDVDYDDYTARQFLDAFIHILIIHKNLGDFQIH